MNIKVIATSFDGGRDIRTDAEFPNHNQKEQDIKKLIDDVIEFEKTNTPGVKTDVLIVNCSNKQRRFIEGLNIETKHGRIFGMNRKNIGGSFGSYSDAFLKYRKNYKYWLFTEDDILIGGNKYYKRLIDVFKSRNNIGFVALISRNLNHPGGIHADGGVGLTERGVLDKIVAKHGLLPHYRGQWNKEAVIAEGEIPFTNEINKLGKEVVVFNSQKGWGFEPKLCLPYYEYKT